MADAIEGARGGRRLVGGFKCLIHFKLRFTYLCIIYYLVYYYNYNTTTNEVTYEEPTLEVAPSEMQSNIDDSSSACWQTAYDEEGIPYYYNIKSGEVQWDKPDSL